MVRIMACGSVVAEDVQLLLAAGVDAIGLITEVKQHLLCNLSREQARILRDSIPPLVSTVLILTANSIDEVCRLVDYVRPDVVQLHGDITPGDLVVLKQKLPVKVVKALLLNGNAAEEREVVANRVRDYVEAGVDAVLVDSSYAGKYGSTGRIVDLELARLVRDMVFPVPLILAGGLNRYNVAGAIKAVEPWGVDVFTGITEAGCLCPARARGFVSEVRVAASREEMIG